MNWQEAGVLISAIIGASSLLFAKVWNSNGRSEFRRSTDSDRLTKVETRLDNLDDDIKELKKLAETILTTIMKGGLNV